MPEVGQITYGLKELTALMLRDQDIHEGLWMIWSKFNFAALNVVGADGGPSGPGVIAQVAELGIQRAPEPSPLTIDAADVWKDLIPLAGLRAESTVAKHERAGKAASKTLRDQGTKRDAKSAAGSALTQRADKKKARK